MKDTDTCPYCDELVEFEFSDDYYMVEEGEEADISICPKCNKEVSMSWTLSHMYHFNKKDNQKE